MHHLKSVLFINLYTYIKLSALIKIATNFSKIKTHYDPNSDVTYLRSPSVPALVTNSLSVLIQAT